MLKKQYLVFLLSFFFSCGMLHSAEVKPKPTVTPTKTNPVKTFGGVEKPSLSTPPPVPLRSPDSVQVPTRTVEVPKEEEPATLFTDGSGLREATNEFGIDFTSSLLLDAVTNPKGGVKESETAFLGHFSLELIFDFEKMVGLDGGSLVLHSIYDFGDDPSEFVGDHHVTSNIEAPDTAKLFQAYWMQKIQKDFTITLGFRDLNALYNASETSAQFLNGAFGVTGALSQTGVNGPSLFPNASFSLNFQYQADSQPFYFQTGFFNALSGNPDRPTSSDLNLNTKEGYLMVTELGVQGSGEGSFKYGLGAWLYNKEHERWDETGSEINNGFYLIADQKLDVFSIFLKSAMAHDKVNPIVFSYEVGASWNDPFGFHEEDTLALGYLRSQLGKDYQKAQGSEDSESVVELLYRAHFWDTGVSLVPDLQYVMNPSFTKDSDPVFVTSLRLEVLF